MYRLYRISNDFEQWEVWFNENYAIQQYFGPSGFIMKYVSVETQYWDREISNELNRLMKEKLPIRKYRNPLITVHELSRSTKEQLQKYKMCSCFFCQKVFPSIEVVEFWGEQTPTCPYCKIDSVLPDRYSVEFLSQMRKEWFP